MPVRMIILLSEDFFLTEKLGSRLFFDSWDQFTLREKNLNVKMGLALFYSLLYKLTVKILEWSTVLPVC